MNYYVYILTNKSGTLYTGVTNDLERRVRQHKARAISRFTARYKIDRLVYYERFNDVTQAIEWEKRIKGWVRVKKISLIESVNPNWDDLSATWDEELGETTTSGVRDPSLR